MDGYYSIRPEGIRRRYKGECLLEARNMGELRTIRLDGLIDELGPLTNAMPLYNQKGDTNVRVSKEGYSMWTKHLEKTW